MVETVKALVNPDIDKLETEISDRMRRLDSGTVAEIRSVRREFSKRLAKSTPATVIELALRILGHPAGPRFLAYELILYHQPALASLNAKLLAQLGQGMASWSDVDTFACYLSGPAWREHQVPDSLIKRWARSSDRWLRRAAIVSTVPLNSKARGGTGDTERTVMVCELVVHDRDDMVIKALSWALRELSKKDAKAVSRFLQEHKNDLAARVKREVNNKLSTGLKNPRRV